MAEMAGTDILITGWLTGRVGPSLLLSVLVSRSLSGCPLVKPVLSLCCHAQTYSTYL